MISTPTSRPHRIDALMILFLWVLLIGTLLVVRPFTRSAEFSAGSPALVFDGFYGIETAADQTPYRWSMRQAWIAIPTPGEHSVLTLQLAGGPGRVVPVQIELNDRPLELEIAPDLRRLTLLTPPQSALRLQLHTASSTFREPGGSRRLGFVVGDIAIRGSGLPSAYLIFLLMISVAGSYAVTRMLNRRRWIGVAAGSGMALLPILWWHLGGWHSPLLEPAATCLIAGSGASLLIILSWLTPLCPPVERHARALLGGALLVLGLLLCGYALIGLQTRFIADDYCQAVIARLYGPLGAVGYWYNVWSGRFSSSLLLAFTTFTGPMVAPIAPIVLLVIWIGGCALLGRRIGGQLAWEHPGYNAWIGALLLIATILAGLPNLFQSLFWHTGVLTYAISMIGWPWYALLIWNAATAHTHRGIWLITCVIGALALSGFSETGAAAFAAVSLLAFAIALFRRCTRATLAALGIGLIVSLIGMALVALAPGNSLRNAELQPPPLALPTLLWEAFSFSALQSTWPFAPAAFHTQNLVVGGSATADLRRLATTPAGIALPPALLGAALFMFGAWVGVDTRRIVPARRIVAVLVTAILSGGLIILAAVMPAYAGLSNHPPDRALIIPQSIAALITASCGWCIGGLLLTTGRVNLIRRGLCLLIVLLLLPGAWMAGQRLLATSAELQPYATAWERLDQVARDAARTPEPRLTLDAPTGMLAGLETLTPDPDYWLNRCIADYYGLEWITSQEPRTEN